MSIQTFLFRQTLRLLGSQMQMRADQFAALGAPRDAVVFLGDSITEFGLWAEWFPDAGIANRGIGGDSTAGVLARLDTAIDQPRAVFLLIGTNDISMGVSQQTLVANVRAILASITSSAPSAQIFVQSIMPRAKSYAERITASNSALRQVTAEAGGTWLDLWPLLEGHAGAIRDQYSDDKLHLNGAGYRAWSQFLAPYVKRAGGSEAPPLHTPAI